MRSRLLVTLTAVLATTAVLAGLVVVLRLAGVLGGPVDTVGEAVRLAPSGAVRYTWTDWAGVRRELGGDGAPTGDVAGLLDAGFDADLTSTSGLVESGPLLEEAYGWSPDTIAWELLAQSDQGAVEVVGLGDVEPADVEARLEALGYQRPEEETGAWVGGAELLARISARTGLVGVPTLQFMAVDAERGLLLASDRQPFLEQAVEAAADPADPEAGLADVLDALEAEPLSAAAYTGAQACGALSMGQASDADQEAADQLLAEAGEVNPLTGFLIAVVPGGGVEVLLGFETDDQARTNADTRAQLAAGPAPGQGGDFAERFAVDEVTATGRVVRMRLDPEPETYVLSDLSSGPVLFATC